MQGMPGMFAPQMARALRELWQFHCKAVERDLLQLCKPKNSMIGGKTNLK